MFDDDLKQWVLQELEWLHEVDPALIGVTVEDGAVTLSGRVKTYAQKWAAVRAARKVRGVLAIADEIEVHPPDTLRVDDSDIARRVAHVLRWNVALPDNDIQARVVDGRVTLTGTVETDRQRRSIEKQVAHVGGVRGITNAIRRAAQTVPTDVADQIRRALVRNAEVEADAIRIRVDGHTVTLSGTVHALHERDVAHRAAWAAPGVQAVIDNIAVG